MPAICQVLYYAFKWLHSFNPHNKPRRLVVLLAPGDKSEKGGTECPGSHISQWQNWTPTQTAPTTTTNRLLESN